MHPINWENIYIIHHYLITSYILELMYILIIFDSKLYIMYILNLYVCNTWHKIVAKCISCKLQIFHLCEYSIDKEKIKFKFKLTLFCFYEKHCHIYIYIHISGPDCLWDGLTWDGLVLGPDVCNTWHKIVAKCIRCRYWICVNTQ